MTWESSVHLVEKLNSKEAVAVRSQIYVALASSATTKTSKILPTILVSPPARLKKWHQPGCLTCADWALAWYHCYGFAGDRTRKNMDGYPGLLRKLMYLDRDYFDDPLDEITEDWINVNPLPQKLTLEIKQLRERSSRELRWLGFALGPLFDDILNAVFNFDEFSVAPGVPDILVWLHAEELSCWFFSEVKGPNDSLRRSQTDWLDQHWGLIRGHFLLTILE
jgi:hypothetical protein